MILETSQDIIDLNVLKSAYINNKKLWGVKLSGGADSALVLYMVVKFLQEQQWNDVELHTITVTKSINPYQKEFAENIANKIEELTGFQLAHRHHFYISMIDDDPTNKGLEDQHKHINSLLDSGVINFIFAGITANPSKDDAPHLYNTDRKGPVDDRDKGDSKKKQYHSGGMVPLINIDKKGVCELYKQLDILDTLFSITRSCESRTTDFSHHCGKCWFCMEREWGFGRLE